MMTAVDGSVSLFDWDLQNIDLSQTDISSPEFSFQDSKFYVRLRKKEGAVNYGCALYSFETLSKPGKIHYRYDLVKRMDNTITLSFQHHRELKMLRRGVGVCRVAGVFDPATIQDHILKIKMWSSEYEFEYDMKDFDINNPSFPYPICIDGNKLRVLLKKKEGGEKYDILFKDYDSSFSNKMYFQVDLFRRDNRFVKSDKFGCSFDQMSECQGVADWIDVDSIRDHVLKVKVGISNPFSDFVEKPIGFDDYRNLLFKKMSSNLSFLVGDEVVFVLRDILTCLKVPSRKPTFR
jgi:hypothetical protein